MQLHVGDCLEVLKGLRENSIDSVITDPPAGISFMGKSWDSDKGGRKEWISWMESVMRECLRVLKPGGHALVWAIPRTSHWTATAIEDAGFEVRDVVTHLFGSGFPKSLDISKAIDKEAGAKREVIGEHPNAASSLGNGVNMDGGKAHDKVFITAPATDDAKKWQGYGTALKPAAEFWILARKPLSEKTVARNVLKHGTGGLNIDKSRIVANSDSWEQDQNLCNSCAVVAAGKAKPLTQETKESIAVENADTKVSEKTLGKRQVAMTTEDTGCLEETSTVNIKESSSMFLFGNRSTGQNQRDTLSTTSMKIKKTIESKICKSCQSEITSDIIKLGSPNGRFPSNLVLSGDAPALLDEQSGILKSGSIKKDQYKDGLKNEVYGTYKGFHLKEDLAASSGGASRFFYCAKVSPSERGEDNKHPTVKPLKLMTYLIKLITPEGGTVLDPFMGSGSTGLAAKQAGFKFIGIEKEQEYFEIAEKRIVSTDQLLLGDI